MRIIILSEAKDLSPPPSSRIQTTYLRLDRFLLSGILVLRFGHGSDWGVLRPVPRSPMSATDMRRSDVPLRPFARTPSGALPSLFYPAYLQHLTSVFSSTSALFCATGRFHPLCHQSLAHSFHHNGGGGGLIPLPTFKRATFKSGVCIPYAPSGRSSPPLPSLSFQPLTNCPIWKSFALITIQQYGGWVGASVLTFKPSNVQRSTGSAAAEDALETLGLAPALDIEGASRRRLCSFWTAARASVSVGDGFCQRMAA